MKNTLLVLFVIVLFTSCTTDQVEIQIENSIQKTEDLMTLPPNSELIKIRYTFNTMTTPIDIDERKRAIKVRFFGTCGKPFQIEICGETKKFAISLYQGLPITENTEYWLVTSCYNRQPDQDGCGGGIHDVIDEDDDIDLD